MSYQPRMCANFGETLVSRVAIVASVMTAGCGSVPESAERLDEVDQAITPNPGSTQTPASEPNDLSGAFPETMYTLATLGCTGTVIAPYAVLTAAHCGPEGVLIRWNGTEFAAGATYKSPYLEHSGSAIYTPDWWIALNNAQKAAGGNQNDWPAQHDLAIFFVPALTPTFLRDRGITPALISPPGGSVGTTNFKIVGVASTTNAASRRSMASAFVAAQANVITSTPRDGYLTRSSAPNLAGGNLGDSGGPTFWLDVQPWLNGTTYVARKVIVGTLQNTGPSGDLPPLNYNPGITMTPNQRLTVRLNAHWTNARAADADGDGIPYDCDSDPAFASSAHNFCPPAIGGPSGTATATAPLGALECRPGYVPWGLTGRFGSLIDQLALKCVAYSCFDQPASCGDTYTTDAFGGEGGGANQQSCVSGSVLVGAQGQASSSLIYSIGGSCAPMSSVRADQTTTAKTALAAMGAGGQGSAYSFDCGNRGEGGHDSLLKGFHARTSDKRWVTGLFPVCEPLHQRGARYVGGSGGGMRYQQCPVDHVAVGTVQRAQGDSINVFGILCAHQATVKQGAGLPASALTLVRTSFANYAAGFINSEAVERYTSSHLPAGTSAVTCAAGYAMTGADFRYSFTAFVNQVTSITCKDIRPGRTGTQTIPVLEGAATGVASASTCPFGGQVNGLYSRSGWLVDGVAMHCVDF